MNINAAVVFFLIGTLLLTLFAFALIISMVIYKRRQQINLTEKLTLQHTYQNQLLQSRLEVQEQSFKYFSEEIHDNVGQVLTLVKLHLHQLETLCEGERADTLIHQSTDLIGKAVGDLRAISHTLNGGMIARSGLEEALQKETGYVTSAKNIPCSLKVSGDNNLENREKELLIFRIIQEAIANALKHGNPTAIDISVDFGAGETHVSVHDNGSGFNTASAGKGIGLSNMETRAGLLGGTLQVMSAPEKGTFVSLTLPMNAPHE